MYSEQLSGVVVVVVAYVAAVLAITISCSIVCSIQTAFEHLLCKKIHAKVETFSKGFLVFVVIFPPLRVSVTIGG